MAAIRRLDQFEFHHVLEAVPCSGLVIFTAPACGACRQLKLVLTQDAPLLPGLQLFEVDAERDLALTREFDVFHLPALFLYHDGRYHARIDAEARPQALRAALEAALAAPPEEAP